MNIILNSIIYILCTLAGLVITGIVFMSIATTIVYFFRKDNTATQKNND